MTYSLKLSLNLYAAGMCWHCQTNKMHTFHCCMHSYNENKHCTASVSLLFQNLMKVCVSCLHGFWIKFADSFEIWFANSQRWLRHSWWTVFNIFFIYSLHQRTPLFWAADEGHVDVVRYLVEQGADINIKDNDGVSEWEYTADCKLVLLVRVCFHSPEQRSLLLIEL